MATSGALSTSNQFIKYKITITEKERTDTQLVNNKTPVDVSVKFYRTNTGYTSYGTGKVYCRIDGKLYSADVTPSQKITNSGIVLFSKSNIEITHSDDGTKTLSVSAWIEHNVVTSSEQSYSQKLSTIARASQPSCVTWPEHTQNVGEFGDTIAIFMNRKSSSFTHTVRYAYGSLNETIAEKVENDTTWEIPVEFMDLIPNNESGSGTIYVDTYNGTTKIGTKSCGFTAKVPASVIPSCSIQVLDATDTKDKYGNLVAGLSKLYVKTSAKTVYSSPIKSYSVFANGIQYTQAEITTGVLSEAGTTVVTATVMDNRGRTSEAAEASFPVLAYNKPLVTSLTVHRCDENGAEDENGEYVRVEFSAEITPLNNKNSAVYTLRYTNNTTGKVTTVPLSDITGRYVVNNYAKVFAADGNSSYSVEIVAKDDIDEIPLGISVSTAFSLYNCHKSGTGWAFGKVSEEERTLENNLELRQIQNRYAYQPSAFNGEKGYTLMASISLNTSNVNAPIVFVLNRRGALCPMTVYVRFASSSTTTDPELGSITYEGDNYGAFLVKVATSKWNLYVDNTSGWSNPCLQDWYTTDNQNARLSVTFPSEQVEALPTPYWRATPAQMRSILDFIYPVGSIYLSYSHVDPATMFGGTWERVKNAFLWAVDESGIIGQTGGEKTHKLTVDEMPSHTHQYFRQRALTKEPVGPDTGTAYASATTVAEMKTEPNTYATGGGAAHNNMPPYIQVSAWRRTA